MKQMGFTVVRRHLELRLSLSVTDSFRALDNVGSASAYTVSYLSSSEKLSKRERRLNPHKLIETTPIWNRRGIKANHRSSELVPSR
ncbi:hypothetical protein Bca101_028935 [Brassica carinata]